MPLFNRERDAKFLKGITKELMHKYIAIEVGIFQLQQEESREEMYMEYDDKFYKQPVRVYALPLIEGKTISGDFGTQEKERPATFAFIHDDLEDKNIHLDLGDIIEYDDKYFEVNKVSTSNYWSGRNPDTSIRNYVTGSDSTGYRYSAVAECHQVSKKDMHIGDERIGLNREDYKGDVTDLL